MKILILQDNFPPRSYGGAGVIAFNMAKGFKSKGHDVSVVSTVKDKKEEGESEYQGLNVYNIYSNYHERWRAYLSLYNPMTVKEVRNIIEKIKPDVVFAHNLHFSLSYHSLKLAKKSGAKVFLVAHDVMLFHYGKLIGNISSNPFSSSINVNYKINFWQQIKEFRKRYNPLRNMIIKRYLRYVDKIFSVSDSLRQALQDNGLGNIETIHNGIDSLWWNEDIGSIEKFKNDHGLNFKKVILFGGRLSEAKGGCEILKTMKKVLEKVPNAVLLVLGKKDDYGNIMLGKANELGIEDKIIFTGWVSGDELKASYHSSDVVVVPSLYMDPFPTVNLEAMACAK
ncbi:MAG: hypothetical protein COU71_02880, partial [Parcubacteria group bacterium CG10_big_fil_rev_8_21_14_0_10_38_31]